MAKPLRVVLFDLDGTLLDTAPDMVGALNALRGEHGLAPLPFEVVRGAVSHGAGRVVKLGFPQCNAAEQALLQQRFLEIYRGALSRETRLFAGMEEVLKQIDAWHLKSGVVTNKAAWLSEPLLSELNLTARLSCIVSGDTLLQRKPHPEPLLYAAKLSGAAADECIYVGDAQRDVQAAHAAGMPALVAAYGYIRSDENSHDWNGDAYLSAPLDLLDWLR